LWTPAATSIAPRPARVITAEEGSRDATLSNADSTVRRALLRDTSGGRDPTAENPLGRVAVRR
jgi:hypothetical protein